MEAEVWLQERGFHHLWEAIEEEGVEDVEDILILFDEEDLVGRSVTIIRCFHLVEASNCRK
eukprot:SAG31_NODE_823_length_11772_cov_10.262229_5_plen_61_part_00